MDRHIVLDMIIGTSMRPRVVIVLYCIKTASHALRNVEALSETFLMPASPRLRSSEHLLEWQLVEGNVPRIVEPHEELSAAEVHS